MKKKHVLGGFLSGLALWAATSASAAPFRVTLPGKAPGDAPASDPAMTDDKPDMKATDKSDMKTDKPDMMKGPDMKGPDAPATATDLTPQQTQFFESKIRPIFAAKCAKCHSAADGKSKGGLVLDTREGWAKGGDNGPAIVSGNPAKSLVIKAVSYSDPDLQMPPKGEKLSDAEIADLTAWIKMALPIHASPPPVP